MHTPGNMGVYERSFSSFLKIVGNVNLSTIDASDNDEGKEEDL